MLTVAAPKDIIEQIMLQRAQRDTKTMMVLLDSMLHAAEKLGIPSNIIFLIIDSYVIQLRKKLEQDLGKEYVIELEKGAEEGGKMWWQWVEKKTQAPPPPPDTPPPPPPQPASKKPKDDGPDYIA